MIQFFYFEPHTYATQYPFCFTDHRLLKPFLHWLQNAHSPTFLSYYIKHDLCSNLKTLVNGHFATNVSMVLVNNDQCNIADIVLDVWPKVKQIESPYYHTYSRSKMTSRQLTSWQWTLTSRHMSW